MDFTNIHKTDVKVIQIQNNSFWLTQSVVPYGI